MQYIKSTRLGLAQLINVITAIAKIGFLGCHVCLVLSHHIHEGSRRFQDTAT